MNIVNNILGKRENDEICPKCNRGKLSIYNYEEDRTECNNPLCSYVR